MSTAPHPIHVSLDGLSVHYALGRTLFGTPPTVRAVDGVSLDIPRNSFFGLVGESGSGKTTLGRAILRAAPVSAGRITYRDAEVEVDVGALDKAGLRDYRTRAQLIFQDPYSSLDPRMSVRASLIVPMRFGGIAQPAQEARVQDLLRLVGLPVDAADRISLSCHRQLLMMIQASASE